MTHLQLTGLHMSKKHLFHFRNVAEVLKILAQHDAWKQVSAFVTSRLEDCESWLYGCRHNSEEPLALKALQPQFCEGSTKEIIRLVKSRIGFKSSVFFLLTHEVLIGYILSGGAESIITSQQTLPSQNACFWVRARSTEPSGPSAVEAAPCRYGRLTSSLF